MVIRVDRQNDRVWVRAERGSALSSVRLPTSFVGSDLDAIGQALPALRGSR